jgi:phosphatidylglycerol:prolipoprotein diacylglycerol transferase
VLGGIAGARLAHVVDKLEYYSADPMAALAFWQGGLAIWGALIGGVSAALLVCRRQRLSFLRLADLTAPGLLVALSIGRLGSIVNGDATGAPSESPLALVYTNAQALTPQLGVPTHPYAAYEILWNLATLAALLPLGRQFRQSGLAFCSYTMLYATGRFYLSGLRQEHVWLYGLQQAQVIALGILAAAFVGALLLSGYSKRTPTNGVSKSSAGAHLAPLGANRPVKPER